MKPLVERIREKQIWINQKAIGSQFATQILSRLMENVSGYNYIKILLSI